MIPVLQTILADPTRDDGHDASGQPGDCYRAALASALELPLGEVPHFATFEKDWVERSDQWFRERGIIRAFYEGDVLARLSYPLYVVPGTDFWGTPVAKIIAALGAGPSPRGSFRHVVVLDTDTGTTIHDPHPSGVGLDLIDEVEILFAIGESA